MLIKGCDKTSSFAHATFTDCSREASISFTGGPVRDVAGVTVSFRGSWAHSTSAIYRELPPPGPPISDFLLEQIYTVFAWCYECVAGAIMGHRGSWAHASFAPSCELPVPESTPTYAGPPLFSHFQPEQIYTVFARVFKCKVGRHFHKLKMRRTVDIQATGATRLSQLILPETVRVFF